MTGQAQTGNLQMALDHAGSMLDKDPKMAAAQAEEIIKVMPNVAAAHLILAGAQRRLGNVDKAMAVLTPVVKALPGVAPIVCEFGLCHAALGDLTKAKDLVKQAVAADREHADSWKALADICRDLGEVEEASEAFEEFVKRSGTDQQLINAMDLFMKGDFAEAEPLARAVLKNNPEDVNAMRVLAEIGMEVGRYDECQYLLETCLELAPDFMLARFNYASVLLRRQRLEAALVQVDKLLDAESENPNYLILKAAILVQKGDHDAAIAIYEALLAKNPNGSKGFMNYGHVLKTVGRIDDSVAAYKKAIALSDEAGEAYWSLANLKTFKFSEDDIAHMKSLVKSEGQGNVEDQSHIAFALGKAFEDRKAYEESFHYYNRGNNIRSIKHRFDNKKNVYDSVRQVKACTAEFFAARKDWGHHAPDPIFILGLPRAGSTLLEQILSSHSQVEGTAELTDIISISRKLGGKERLTGVSKYPEILSELSEDEVVELGKSYIETTAVQRHGTPFFIDKMPNNFQHIGLIHLILPNAKIIDARRHPMAGCFAGFKQLFARGQTFTYGLEKIGYYYRDYVRLMDHWDAVLPGRVHRVHYEDMVANTEEEIRKLLDYCGLPFEESCLRFYETERAIRTPSAEQVRQPIYKGALEQWRNYEPWLDPLKEALGSLLDRYPIDKD